MIIKKANRNFNNISLLNKSTIPNTLKYEITLYVKNPNKLDFIKTPHPRPISLVLPGLGV